jgi:hypothetical protein
MNRQKILLLVVGALVISGVVAFQMRTSRRPPSPAAFAATERAVPAEERAPEPPPGPSGPPAARKTLIPPAGWGRNPFLTADEIAALDAPEEPALVPIEVPEEAPPQPPAPPSHELKGIVANQEGSVAVIDSRVVRVGDRIGAETVREIRMRSIVLESENGTREISLKTNALNGVRQAVPKGEIQ